MMSVRLHDASPRSPRAASTALTSPALWVAASLVWMSCAKPVPPPTSEPSTTQDGLLTVAVAGVTDPTLRQLLHDHWDDRMRRSPEYASQLGDRRFDDRIADASLAAATDWRAAARGFRARAEQIPTESLSPADRTTRAVFLALLDSDLADTPCRFEHWSITPARNAVADLTGTLDHHTLDSPAAAEALLSRLRAMPAAVDAELARLQAGLEDGRVAGAESVRRTLSFIDGTLQAPESESVLFAPLRDLDAASPAVLEGRARDRFDARYRSAIDRELLPAFARYRAFLEDTVLPSARPADRATLAGLPDGAACYAGLVRRYTTLDTTAEAVHERGLAEIARIHEEFRTVGEAALGISDLPTLFATLRTDDRFRFETEAEILDTAESALRAAEAAVPAVLHSTPTTPCSVAPVPAHIAPYTYVAWYEPPTAETGGIYRVNTHDPETRLRHEAHVLAFHESVPGHHLQLAWAQELDAVPAFRRHGQFTAYVEGWALYSERLADELGLYPSEVERLGMLSFDAWRAARLVVDTGLHHHGWTRAQAEAWMLENTPLAENNITNEVDRYIGWPGQAVAYKTGQLELLTLRDQAEDALGEAFLLADFHAVVLGMGPVPLPVLRSRVEAWTAAGGGTPD